MIYHLTLSQTTYLRVFQTERVCRQCFQIWWTWQKFLQTVRKHHGKRNFSWWAISLFPPQCFQKTCTADMYKPMLVWERVNPFPNDKILTFPKLKDFADKNFKFDGKGRKFSKRVEKHGGKRRNCSSSAISLFPTVYSTFLENFPPFSSNLQLPSANFFGLEEVEICRLGKG